MRSRFTACVLAVVLGSSAAMFGCSDSWNPSAGERERVKACISMDATWNVALGFAGSNVRAVQPEEIYDETYTLSQTSHGCWKVTVDYKFDSNGNTKTESWTGYFANKDFDRYCSKASDHMSEGL